VLAFGSRLLPGLPTSALESGSVCDLVSSTERKWLSWDESSIAAKSLDPHVPTCWYKLPGEDVSSPTLPEHLRSHFPSVTLLRLSLGAYGPNSLLRNSRGYTSRTPGSVESIYSREILEYTVQNGRGLRSRGQDSTKSISGNAFEHVTASGPSRGRLTL